MRFHERDYICANVCMTVVNERAITKILFQMKVISVHSNILSPAFKNITLTSCTHRYILIVHNPEFERINLNFKKTFKR